MVYKLIYHFHWFYSWSRDVSASCILEALTVPDFTSQNTFFRFCTEFPAAHLSAYRNLRHTCCFLCLSPFKISTLEMMPNIWAPLFWSFLPYVLLLRLSRINRSSLLSMVAMVTQLYWKGGLGWSRAGSGSITVESVLFWLPGKVYRDIPDPSHPHSEGLTHYCAFIVSRGDPEDF